MTLKGLFLLFFLNFTTVIFAQYTTGSVKVNTQTGIEKIVNAKIAYNKSVKTVKGYKIQLFYGSEKGAYDSKEKFEKLFPEIPAKLTFSTPDWKIQVGNYFTKLQADKDLENIKLDFPGAIVLATDIDIPENNKK
ncbi:SPOR domain-containing protein [Namhaeicola litoreus]|uniref:SPOR domain-containing protein n=1 Tax=Namhaeicola litoreus TaxID=1052145 RepID=A0ABW3XZA5_9FLAO